MTLISTSIQNFPNGMERIRKPRCQVATATVANKKCLPQLMRFIEQHCICPEHSQSGAMGGEHCTKGSDGGMNAVPTKKSQGLEHKSNFGGDRNITNVQKVTLCVFS